MSDNQHKNLIATLQKGGTLNLDNETFSGFEITVNTAEGGISWLTVDMYGETDLGEVDWEIV